MILYGMRASPFVRKVLMYAAERGLELEVVAAGLGERRRRDTGQEYDGQGRHGASHRHQFTHGPRTARQSLRGTVATISREPCLNGAAPGD